jgi:hypothetical protein
MNCKKLETIGGRGSTYFGYTDDSLIILLEAIQQIREKADEKYAFLPYN